MADDLFNATELEAGAEALTRYLESICEHPGVVVPYTATGCVLDAVAPLVAARVRTEVVEEIAAYFDAWASAAGAVAADAMVESWQEAARLARAHATTTEETTNA